jgi:hypothetical protein
MTAPTSVPGAWERALANFGEDVVAYVVDTVPGSQPSIEDRARWEVIRSLASPLDEEGLAAEQRVSLRCHFLGQVIHGTGQTYVEVCREVVGGRTPVPSNDELVDAFVRLVFVGLAMEHVDGSEWDRFSISAAFQDPALCNPAAVAFLQDGDLKRLFPEASLVPDERGLVSADSLMTWLPSGGGSTFLGIVIGCFVEQTLARMRFMNALDEDDIEAFVRESLDQLRIFARGDEVTALILTGLVGIEVAEPLDRESWGIRSSDGLAINQLPYPGALRPRSVLWTKAPHRLLSVSRSDLGEDQISATFEAFGEHATEFYAYMRRRTMSLQFGLLAWAVESGRESPVNLLATTSWSLIPLAQTQPPHVLQHAGLGHSTQLEAKELAAVSDIVDEVGDVTPRLDVALARMIRVASEQRDPVDALIDAVIAWENMLGSKSETTFKVCAEFRFTHSAVSWSTVRQSLIRILLRSTGGKRSVWPFGHSD